MEWCFLILMHVQGWRCVYQHVCHIVGAWGHSSAPTELDSVIMGDGSQGRRGLYQLPLPGGWETLTWATLASWFSVFADCPFVLRELSVSGTDSWAGIHWRVRAIGYKACWVQSACLKSMQVIRRKKCESLSTGRASMERTQIAGLGFGQGRGERMNPAALLVFSWGICI